MGELLHQANWHAMSLLISKLKWSMLNMEEQHFNQRKGWREQRLPTQNMVRLWTCQLPTSLNKMMTLTRHEIVGDRVIPWEGEAITQTTLAHASLNPTISSSSLAVPQTVATAKKKIQAQFGHSWTYNEQILVAPWGIIIARETFYYAESITAAVVVCASQYHNNSTV